MWRIIERLYLGDGYDAANQAALTHIGVSHILNCASTVPFSFPDAFRYLHLNVSPQHFGDAMPELCDFIERGRAAGSVLVHCSDARERSPAAVITYLCHSGLTVDDAIQTLKNAMRDRPTDFAPPPLPLMQPILDRFDT